MVRGDEKSGRALKKDLIRATLFIGVIKLMANTMSNGVW